VPRSSMGRGKSSRRAGKLSRTGRVPRRP
jgi:hypothetical protein